MLKNYQNFQNNLKKSKTSGGHELANYDLGYNSVTVFVLILGLLA